MQILKISLAKIFRRRNIEMEKNESSGIPDHDVVVSPDDPDDPNDPVVSTDYDEKEFHRVLFNRCASHIGKRRGEFPQVYIDLESSSSKHEKHQPNDIRIVIEELEYIFGAEALKNIHERPVRQCCVYKVPRDLRNIDIKAYTPQVISIGPFHHGNTVLSEMENQKLRYMFEFGRREGPEKVKEFKRFIEEKEQIIRNYYQENSKLESPEFVKMILRDAVFIIEFFLKNAEPVNERKFDFFLDTLHVRAAITRDLQLLENQLPYFLLKNLFVKGAFLNFTKKDYPHHDPFLILSLRFFFNTGNEVFPKPKNRIQHFTDLIRYFLLMDFLQQDQKQGEYVRDLPTATKLHGSGVKFKKQEIEGGSSLKITCEYVPRAIRIPYFKSCQLPIPYFKACELRIPCIKIDDWSECLYRNLMALELCLYPSETHICNFILLMDFLINTEKDVDLFVKEGIIFSLLVDNATVTKMFNNLGLQIIPSPSVYHDICKKLKEHYDSHRCVRRWNDGMATLKTVYFGGI
ncbi:hypothetical protein EZV62_025448 [Acer yangbiense]|uniref:Uncharacterized protein n=1 Tax=Acer yangbiense TaxID=1000413 RepID=A0A5C7GXU1_9ROSI|nr:hypothetical protein EZV62_025448 [Acer yangbiense]